MTYDMQATKEAWEVDMEYFSAIADQNRFTTRWSIYEEGICVADASPYSAGTVIRNRCKVWGYDTHATVEGNGSWMDVWAACEKVITEAGDHHVYIEGFEQLADGTINVMTGS